MVKIILWLVYIVSSLGEYVILSLLIDEVEEKTENSKITYYMDSLKGVLIWFGILITMIVPGLNAFSFIYLMKNYRRISDFLGKRG